MNPRVVLSTTLIVTAVTYGLLAAVASSLPLVGLLLQFLVIFSLCRYAYDVLRSFGQGHLDAPAVDFDSMNPFARWSYLLHFIAFPAAIAGARIYLPAGWLFAALVAAVFPASAALMAITNRLDSAFSPSAVASFVRILGRDYVWLAIAMLIVLSGAALAGRALSLAGSFPVVAVLLAVDGWALLAVFALTGSAVHAHRLDFDVPGDRPDAAELAHADRERAWQSVLDRAYASLRGGRPEAGYRDLRRFLAEQDHNPEAYYWLVEHLLDWDDPRHALGVAGTLISTEIELGRIASAFELYRRCRRLGGTELGPAAASALARYAESIGQHGVASELDALSRPAAGAPEA